jgi:3-phosphoglycerate kinase
MQISGKISYTFSAAKKKAIERYNLTEEKLDNPGTLMQTYKKNLRSFWLFTVANQNSQLTQKQNFHSDVRIQLYA